MKKRYNYKNKKNTEMLKGYIKLSDIELYYHHTGIEKKLYTDISERINSKPLWKWYPNYSCLVDNKHNHLKVKAYHGGYYNKPVTVFDTYIYKITDLIKYFNKTTEIEYRRKMVSFDNNKYLEKLNKLEEKIKEEENKKEIEDTAKKIKEEENKKEEDKLKKEIENTIKKIKEKSIEDTTITFNF